LVIAHGVYNITHPWFTKTRATPNAAHVAHPAHAGESSSLCCPGLHASWLPMFAAPNAKPRSSPTAAADADQVRSPISCQRPWMCSAWRSEWCARAGRAAPHSSMPVPSKLLHVCGPQGKAGVTADGVRGRGQACCPFSWQHPLTLSEACPCQRCARQLDVPPHTLFITA